MTKLPIGMNIEVFLSEHADLRSTHCIMVLITPMLCSYNTVSLTGVHKKSGNAKHLFLHLKYGMQPSMKRAQMTKYFMITCKSFAKALFQPTHFHVTVHANATEMVVGTLFLLGSSYW